jgi:MFS family permease
VECLVISRSMPRGIWALGLVSLFMDASSELVHSLLPVFMVTTLGATAASVGVIEGIAEATGLIVKIISGSLSDLLGKRKLLTVIGYGLAAITKPLFPLADTIGLVMAARFIDRIGKGIRGAPRDALIGDIAPPEIRGACFGLRQSLDTVGAFLGPLLAMLAMLLMDNDIRAVLWIAVVPAFIAVAVLVFGVREPETARVPGHARIPIHLRDIRHVGRAYWQLVGLAGFLTLARFSEAFLVLKAQAVGLPVAYVPVILIVMNTIYSLSAYPVGILSDRSSRTKVLLAGVFFLLVADLALGLANGLWMLALGVVFWGLHMGFTQGVFATMIADTIPAELRGTAYGVFNLVCGITILLASAIAGVLWDTFGSAAPFYAGAIFTGGALIGLLRFTPTN